MSSSVEYYLQELSDCDLSMIEDYANDIYQTSADNYPEFALNLSRDLTSQEQRREFFQAFVMPACYNNYNIRQAYCLKQEDKIISIVGVRRWTHWPSWSVSWLLSKNVGLEFVTTFRQLIQQLCQVHESAGMNEFFVSYPTNREAAYSRIMLPFRKRYHTFIETTVKSGERSPYSFIHQLLGERLYQYDMNLRRYILQRSNPYN
jgi:hypothetical protein